LALLSPKARPRLALVLLAAIGVVGFIDRIIMNVLVEPLKAEFSLNDTEIGVINGLAFAALNVGLGLFVARQAERRRRISLIAIGTFLWSIATAACGMAGNVTNLLLARIGVGVGEAVGLPATQSVVSDYFPRDGRRVDRAALWLASCFPRRSSTGPYPRDFIGDFHCGAQAWCTGCGGLGG
jgi:MFS family permease